MKTFQYYTVYFCVIFVLAGCSILPEQRYTPVERYDFGVINTVEHQQGLKTGDIHVLLHGPHPNKWTYRVSAYKIKQLEYLRWSPSLDELIQSYVYNDISGSSSSVPSLQLTIYKWEYNVEGSYVLAEYAVDTPSPSGKSKRFQLRVSVPSPPTNDHIAEGFSQLMKKVSQKIKEGGFL